MKGKNLYLKNMPSIPMTIIINSNENKCTVSPQGGYVTSWVVKNPKTQKSEEILYAGSELKRTGIPLLFPNYGYGGDLPKHGFARDSLWQILQKISDQISLVLTDQKNYPFLYEAKIVVKIQDNNLFYSLIVKNLDNLDLPISPGLHPYWSIPHNQKKSIQTDIPGFNPLGFDWDVSPPDNAYPFNGKSEIKTQGKKITIEDISSKPVITNIRVWSQTPDNLDFNFVCFEPLCGYDNDIINNPILVKPQEEWRMDLKFSIDF